MDSKNENIQDPLLDKQIEILFDGEKYADVIDVFYCSKTACGYTPSIESYQYIIHSLLRMGYKEDSFKELLKYHRRYKGDSFTFTIYEVVLYDVVLIESKKFYLHQWLYSELCKNSHHAIAENMSNSVILDFITKRHRKIFYQYLPLLLTIVVFSNYALDQSIRLYAPLPYIFFLIVCIGLLGLSMASFNKLNITLTKIIGGLAWKFWRLCKHT
jgi:hypothetical protein